MSNAIKPVERMNMVLSNEDIRAQFRNALRENAGAFIASLIDLYNGDKYLQQCDPQAVVMEALKAASLKLPINKQLGFAFIVPYKNVPQFQVGYKGLIQLAMRSGQYRRLNAGIIPEGITVRHDLLTGDITVSGEAKSDKPQGYFAYLELLNGFTKTLYMATAEVIAWAKRYSKSYKNPNSAWHTNFDEMAIKTPLRRLLSKYGILSTEMVTALSLKDDETEEAEFAEEVAQNANKEAIDVQFTEGETQAEKPEDKPPVDEEHEEPAWMRAKK